MFRNFRYYWAELIINNRVSVLLTSIIMLITAIILIIKFPLKYDNSFEMFMLKDDPNIVKFENFRNLFGDAEYLSVGIQARPNDTDLFTAETIKLINDISSMLEDHEFVTKVSSLSKYQYTHSDGGIMVTDDLFEDPESLEEESLELSNARQIISAEVLAHDSIITKDLRDTRIIVRTEYIRNENNHKVKVSNDIYQFLADKDYVSDGYKIRLGGGAIISERFENLSKRDTSILNPIVAVIMCLMLYWLYGSILACFLPWFLIASSIGLVTGLQAILKFPMTVVNGALIPTLMIIGMGVSVHVMSEFFLLRKNGDVPTDAAKKNC
jgi:predicted RND superfamily exporter protein